MFISSVLHKGPQHSFPEGLNREPGGIVCLLGSRHPEQEDETPTTLQQLECARTGAEHGSVYAYVDDALVLGVVNGSKE